MIIGNNITSAVPDKPQRKFSVVNLNDFVYLNCKPDSSTSIINNIITLEPILLKKNSTITVINIENTIYNYSLFDANGTQPIVIPIEYKTLKEICDDLANGDMYITITNKFIPSLVKLIMETYDNYDHYKKYVVSMCWDTKYVDQYDPYEDRLYRMLYNFLYDLYKYFFPSICSVNYSIPADTECYLGDIILLLRDTALIDYLTSRVKTIDLQFFMYILQNRLFTLPTEGFVNDNGTHDINPELNLIAFSNNLKNCITCLYPYIQKKTCESLIVSPGILNINTNNNNPYFYYFLQKIVNISLETMDLKIAPGTVITDPDSTYLISLNTQLKILRYLYLDEPDNQQSILTTINNLINYYQKSIYYIEFGNWYLTTHLYNFAGDVTELVNTNNNAVYKIKYGLLTPHDPFIRGILPVPNSMSEDAWSQYNQSVVDHDTDYGANMIRTKKVLLVKQRLKENLLNSKKLQNSGIIMEKSVFLQYFYPRIDAEGDYNPYGENRNKWYYNYGGYAHENYITNGDVRRRLTQPIGNRIDTTILPITLNNKYTNETLFYNYIHTFLGLLPETHFIDLNTIKEHEYDENVKAQNIINDMNYENVQEQKSSNDLSVDLPVDLPVDSSVDSSVDPSVDTSYVIPPVFTPVDTKINTTIPQIPSGKNIIFIEDSTVYQIRTPSTSSDPLKPSTVQTSIDKSDVVTLTITEPSIIIIIKPPCSQFTIIYSPQILPLCGIMDIPLNTNFPPLAKMNLFNFIPNILQIPETTSRITILVIIFIILILGGIFGYIADSFIDLLSTAIETKE